MAKDKETPTWGAWHRDPAGEKTCPIGSCRRDGGEFRASQRLATGTRGSGQSDGPCARNGSRRETPTDEKEQQGRGGGRYVIQEGNRAPVFKATHSRYEERPGSQRTKRRCLSGQIECSYGHIGLSEKVCVKERAPPFGSLCRPLI